jgi:cytochrome c oxidase assembly protein Cox11
MHKSKCEDYTLIYLIMLGYETVQIYRLFCPNDKINDILMTLQIHSHLIMIEFNHYKISIKLHS